MSGSTFGTLFRITTFGESHGLGIGAIIDGCPSGIPLSEEDIQVYLNRRKPGQNPFSTPRVEADVCKILSGVFDGKTTGTPIMVVVENTNQQSGDYSEIASYYRPGHADYPWEMKYGFRDYRGGGRSSGRETTARVIGGAIAAKALSYLGVKICAFTQNIGPIYANKLNLDEISENPFCMPDNQAARLASGYVSEIMEKKDSAGGVIACIVEGMPVGVGEPVFDKLDAELAKAVMSVGAMKGMEIGAGFAAASLTGSTNNDEMYIENGKIAKRSNHSGGISGGMSDGDTIILKVAVKPTSSISSKQRTVNNKLEEIEVEVKGRHDPLIVPRAVVVIESMTAITVFDMMLRNMASKMTHVLKVYGVEKESL